MWNWHYVSIAEAGNWWYAQGRYCAIGILVYQKPTVTLAFSLCSQFLAQWYNIPEQQSCDPGGYR